MVENILHDISNERLSQQERIFDTLLPEVNPEELQQNLLRELITNYIKDYIDREKDQWLFADDEPGEVIIHIDDAITNFIEQNFSGLPDIENLMETVEDYDRERGGTVVYHEIVQIRSTDNSASQTEENAQNTFSENLPAIVREVLIPTEMDDLFPLLAELYDYYTQHRDKFTSQITAINKRIPLNFEQSLAIYTNDPSQDKTIWREIVYNPIFQHFKKLFAGIDQSSETIRTDHIIKIVGDAIALGCPEILDRFVYSSNDVKRPELSSIIARLTEARRLQVEHLEKLELPLFFSNVKLIAE